MSTGVAGEEAKFGENCQIGCASKMFAAFIAASDLHTEITQSNGVGSGVESLAPHERNPSLGL